MSQKAIAAFAFVIIAALAGCAGAGKASAARQQAEWNEGVAAF